MLASKHNNCEHCLRKRYISKDWYKEPLEMIRRMIHTDWYDYFDYSAVFGAQGRCPWIRWSLINAVLFHLQLSKACRPRGGPRKQWTQNRREMAELSWLLVVHWSSQWLLWQMGSDMRQPQALLGHADVTELIIGPHRDFPASCGIYF